MPTPPPLASIPPRIGGWSQSASVSIPQDALDMLGPDDYVARLYQDSHSPTVAELFVAYYKTQLRAKNAHDPKVCLPGAGWNPTESHVEQVAVPGSRGRIPVNYYQVSKDADREVVLYWFQTFNGVYTFEQQLKAHRIWDAIVDNRTDMALVRIIVPVTNGSQNATESATRLAQAMYTKMLEYFPSGNRHS
jgi:EpsI family protein